MCNHTSEGNGSSVLRMEDTGTRHQAHANFGNHAECDPSLVLTTFSYATAGATIPGATVVRSVRWLEHGGENIADWHRVSSAILMCRLQRVKQIGVTARIHTGVESVTVHVLYCTARFTAQSDPSTAPHIHNRRSYYSMKVPRRHGLARGWW